MLVDIHVIIFMEIISNVDIRITVHINISHCYTQTITKYRTIDACLLCYIRKYEIAVITIDMISGTCYFLI